MTTPKREATATLDELWAQAEAMGCRISLRNNGAASYLASVEQTTNGVIHRTSGSGNSLVSAIVAAIETLRRMHERDHASEAFALLRRPDVWTNEWCQDRDTLLAAVDGKASEPALVPVFECQSCDFACATPGHEKWHETSFCCPEVRRTHKSPRCTIVPKRAAR